MAPGALILYLDLFGTFFFALSGGFRAIKYEMDLLGIVVLSIAVGVGGGLIRDTMLGVHPPAALDHEIYLVTCIIAGLVVFAFAPRIASRWNLVLIADAVGLGVFAALGSSKAASVGLGVTGMVLCGTISAVGGGVVRDVLSGERPAILFTGFYASAAIIGSFAYWLAARLAYGFNTAFTQAALLTILLRLLALRYNLRLPRRKALPASPSEVVARKEGASRAPDP